MASFMKGVALSDYTFIFKMDNDMPPNVMRKWTKLCVAGSMPKPVIAAWRHRFGTDAEVLDRWLQRCEGGVGGDDNRTDRQIRYIPVGDRPVFPKEKEPTFWVLPLSPDDGTDPWTLEDLLPYLTALRHALADLTTEGSGAVQCYISCNTCRLE
jgi:hypothetical protein